MNSTRRIRWTHTYARHTHRNMKLKFLQNHIQQSSSHSLKYCFILNTKGKTVVANRSLRIHGVQHIFKIKTIGLVNNFDVTVSTMVWAILAQQMVNRYFAGREFVKMCHQNFICDKMVHRSFTPEYAKYAFLSYAQAYTMIGSLLI